MAFSAVLREQMRGQVDAFESRESESLQSVKPVAAAAKQLDNFGVARPAGGSQIPQPFGKFLNIHQMSLSSGDSPFMPLRKGDMSRLCLGIGAAQTTAQGGVNDAN